MVVASPSCFASRSCDHGLLGVLDAQAVDRAGVDRGARAGGRDAGDGRVLLAGADDHPDGQVERLGEVEVALVVGGDGHDRAGAVVAEHVVGGVDRDLLAGDRVDRGAAQRHAGLGAVGGHPLDLRERAGRGRILPQGLALFRGDDALGQVGVGGHDEERRAVDGVGAGGEDADALVHTLDLEVGVGARRPADPVALHAQHVVRPGLELLHVVQQPLRVVGDLEEPLGQVAAHDLGAAALAAALHDLLVGQHRQVVRAPVDRRGVAVGQAALEHLDEQPLVPAVVLRVRGVQQGAPVEADAQPAEPLLLHRDVVVRPALGAQATLDRRVLGRQAEGVPADAVEHVEALEPLVAGHGVADRVDLGVAHVQVAGGIREHADDEAVVAARLDRRRPGKPAGLIHAAVVPDLDPRVDIAGGVFGHIAGRVLRHGNFLRD